MNTTTSTPVRKITRQRLINMFAAMRGAKMCTIITNTEPRMRKTNNPYAGLVTKRCRMNITVGFIYTNSVNKARGKEGNDQPFVASERKWGQKVPGTPFVMHNGAMYVEAKPNAGKPQVEYFHKVSGEVILKETLSQWLQEPSSNAEHQGVSEENEVIVRTYSINNITDLIYGGKHYKVIG
jgi:hypothetical protein